MLNINAKTRAIEQGVRTLNDDCGFGEFVRIRHDIFEGPARSKKPPATAHPSNRHRHTSDARRVIKNQNYAERKREEGCSPPRRKLWNIKQDANKQAMEDLHVDPATKKVVSKDGSDCVDPDSIDGTHAWHWQKVPKVLKKPKGKGSKGGKSGSKSSSSKDFREGKTAAHWKGGRSKQK